jgi:energy-coupling factor transporter ATP-binding protein EcfA2
MDFFQICVKEKKGGGQVAAPDFIVGRSEDLMVRAKDFYAIWDEDANLWSKDPYDVQRIVDAKLRSYAESRPEISSVNYMKNFSSRSWSQWVQFLKAIGDNSKELDQKLTFADDVVKKKDYRSKRLPYSLKVGDHSSWDELVGTLYDQDEKDKIEWAIGAIVSGESTKIHKFVVFYGPPGSGKSTIITVIQKLFDSYIATFDAKALTSSNNAFSTEAFQHNPLVAIQHDGNLSGIQENSVLNAIVSHEDLWVNAKYKPQYQTRINAFLFMGTNKPVKITDAQSGIIRRLIDVHPSGKKLPHDRWEELMTRIDFELGAIAQHCLVRYKELGGRTAYNQYKPTEMMLQTNIFYNFIEAYGDVFMVEDGITADRAYDLYLDFCDKSHEDKPMKRPQFRTELKQYFEEFHARISIDGLQLRSYYRGFKDQAFRTTSTPLELVPRKKVLVEEETSLLDLEFADCPAQYANAKGAPRRKWDEVTTVLSELDTSQEHYVNGFPDTHIVIDFDITDEDGNKSLDRNLEAAALWPDTYTEISRSGNAVHKHYNYTGPDVTQLASVYSPGIEIKVYSGNQALRRRVTRCNNLPVADIDTGLPLKEKKRVLTQERMKDETTVRRLIKEALKKGVHGGTKSNVDFIKKVLDDAYEQGMIYNVNDLEQAIVNFALSSTNQRMEALKVVKQMKWSNADGLELEKATPIRLKDGRLVFYDIEVYPNLFVVCWKFEGDEGRESVNRMINPTAEEIGQLFELKLVGFNNRRYDNHILWAAYLGCNNAQLYDLSQRIVNGVKGVMFREAYGISWTDIYDYSTVKQGLKKFQIELGIEHREMDIPWDEPVPEERILDVVEYCVNDVMSTEAVHLYRRGDYQARLILADLSGLSANDTTQAHTARIVFGRDKNPRSKFVYTDLSKEFPGYVYDSGKSTYRGETVGEGGYVYSEPGLYTDVALLDVASMHPTSIIQLNAFGEYTPRFAALVEAQLALKAGDLDGAAKLLDGKLRPYIQQIRSLEEAGDPVAAKTLRADIRQGLKIAINIVYGLTSASFENAFRDPRNKDNIVAKRGALFMIDLKHYIQDLGFKAVHIKTDSVKIPNATPEIIEKVQNFAAKYGYNMEYNPDEEQYSKLGLFDKANYVAKKDKCISHCWTATGAQFNPDVNPFVFKKLFGGEDDIVFDDLCVTKQVMSGGAMYLDFGAFEAYQRNGAKRAEFAANGVEVTFPNGDDFEEPIGHVERLHSDVKLMQRAKADKNNPADVEARDQSIQMYEQKVVDAAGDPQTIGLVHVGRVGRFTPVKMEAGGGDLWRVKDGKFYTVQGTKGHFWTNSDVAAGLPGDAIDMEFFNNLVKEGKAQIEKFLPGSDFDSVEAFLS